MIDIGNTILERDEENQRLLIAYATEQLADVWGCIICLTSGNGIVICDNYEELENHCDEIHEGWRENGQT